MLDLDDLDIKIDTKELMSKSDPDKPLNQVKVLIGEKVGDYKEIKRLEKEDNETMRKFLIYIFGNNGTENYNRYSDKIANATWNTFRHTDSFDLGLNLLKLKGYSPLKILKKEYNSISDRILEFQKKVNNFTQARTLPNGLDVSDKKYAFTASETSSFKDSFNKLYEAYLSEQTSKIAKRVTDELDELKLVPPEEFKDIVSSYYTNTVLRKAVTDYEAICEFMESRLAVNSITAGFLNKDQSSLFAGRVEDFFSFLNCKMPDKQDIKTALFEPTLEKFKELGKDLFKHLSDIGILDYNLPQISLFENDNVSFFCEVKNGVISTAFKMKDENLSPSYLLTSSVDINEIDITDSSYDILEIAGAEFAGDMFSSFYKSFYNHKAEVSFDFSKYLKELDATVIADIENFKDSDLKTSLFLQSGNDININLLLDSLKEVSFYDKNFHFENILSPEANIALLSERYHYDLFASKYNEIKNLLLKQFNKKYTLDVKSALNNVLDDFFTSPGVLSYASQSEKLQEYLIPISRIVSLDNFLKHKEEKMPELQKRLTETLNTFSSVEDFAKLKENFEEGMRNFASA